TAMEPIMRACSGTWIAHGSGSADADVVDEHDRVQVPPERPAYSLRRVWLTEEEEDGYYYGFANEGLWPLCHLAHVRPVFRSSDTFDRYLEARIEHESSIVSYRGTLTRVEHYPISVQWPSEWADTADDTAACRARVFKREGLRSDMQLGVGVDRMDYTKGILE